jgi:hypothetical protein
MATSPVRPFVGLQLEHQAFEGQDAERLLDGILQHVPVNTLMIFTGPLSAVFYDAGYGDGRSPYCFCEHCRRLGTERGIDPNAPARATVS